MSNYDETVIEPGDQISKLASQVNKESYGNNSILDVIEKESANFRSVLGFKFSKSIFQQMLEERICQTVQNDGAGHKTLLISLLSEANYLRKAAYEIIAMSADDISKEGGFPFGIVNDLQIKNVNIDNLDKIKIILNGYARALKEANLIGLTGETAIMKHALRSPFETPKSPVFLWNATCLGLMPIESPFVEIKPAMKIVGIREHGVRCNGSSELIRQIQKRWPDQSADRLWNNQELREFLKITMKHSLYYGTMLSTLCGWWPEGVYDKPLLNIGGIAHITGGGIKNKLGELLPDGVGATLSNMGETPEALSKIQDLSLKNNLYLTDVEMYKIFHGGFGMMIVLDKNQVRDLINFAKKFNFTAELIGDTIAGDEIFIKSNLNDGKSIIFQKE